jgi:hypothetical protein
LIFLYNFEPNFIYTLVAERLIAQLCAIKI